MWVTWQKKPRENLSAFFLSSSSSSSPRFCLNRPNSNRCLKSSDRRRTGRREENALKVEIVIKTENVIWLRCLFLLLLLLLCYLSLGERAAGLCACAHIRTMIGTTVAQCVDQGSQTKHRVLTASAMRIPRRAEIRTRMSMKLGCRSMRSDKLRASEKAPVEMIDNLGIIKNRHRLASNRGRGVCNGIDVFFHTRRAGFLRGNFNSFSEPMKKPGVIPQVPPDRNYLFFVSSRWATDTSNRIPCEYKAFCQIVRMKRLASLFFPLASVNIGYNLSVG